MRKLPNKPSKLLRLALADLEACEQDPDYRIDMTVYHTPRYFAPEGKVVCEICLAGAALAKTFRVPKTKQTDPSSEERLHRVDRARLRWLDDIRLGIVRPDRHVQARLPGWKELDRLLKLRTIPPYIFSPTNFKKALFALADELEALDL